MRALGEPRPRQQLAGLDSRRLTSESGARSSNASEPPQVSARWRKALQRPENLTSERTSWRLVRALAASRRLECAQGSLAAAELACVWRRSCMFAADWGGLKAVLCTQALS